MNENQKKIPIAVAAIIFCMLLYPPFRGTHPRLGDYLHGYYWLLDHGTGDWITVHIGLLLTQWLGVLLIGGLAYMALRK